MFAKLFDNCVMFTGRPSAYTTNWITLYTLYSPIKQYDLLIFVREQI